MQLSYYHNMQNMHPKHTFATTGSERQGRFCMTKTLLAIYFRPYFLTSSGHPYIGNYDRNKSRVL